MCLAVSENLMLLAVGYDNGTVVLYRGDATREQKGNKQRAIMDGQDAISGLSFKYDPFLKLHHR